ncbi:Aste57867_22181 [Aphanomyces stellatus]|uniref:Aste57867_22181 protein n=1 Tax=Aphanomyces stellatus TaxID=120398 RepID=A0A485LJG4_9STRA|nr:hypothetical protein As57867_022112 [Aphanomyces stellatus]VFT98848.1 Aste57867_22181 [Aphanomyces stellatus]
MTKYKSKGTFFGTSNKRWFKVTVANADSPIETQRLTLSYYKTKKATEPRGWIFLEDVTDINAKPDMIEIVSPSRTLRVKGDTSAEHRMWLESLKQLCFPEPAPPADPPIAAPPKTEPRAEHIVASKQKTVRYDEASKPTNAPPVEAKSAPPKEEKGDGSPPAESRSPPRKSPPKDDRKVVDEKPREVPPAETKESIREEPPVAEAKAKPAPVARTRSGSVMLELKRDDSQGALDFSESESDDDDGGENAAGMPRRSHAQESEMAVDVEEAKEANIASPEEGAIDSKHPEGGRAGNNPSEFKGAHVDDDDDDTQVERFTPPSPKKPPTHKHASDYFDDDEGGDEQTAASSPPKETPQSVVRGDNNFVTEDWDAEDVDEPSPPAKAPKPALGVAADANFVTEDWD